MTRPVRGTAVAGCLLTSVLLAGGCVPAGELQDDGDASGASGDDSLKVGLLLPLTGTMAGPGEDMRKGWELYWNMHGETVGDRQVESLIEDSAGSPDTALNRAKRLSDEQDVDVFVGELLTNVSVALGDYVTRSGKPIIQPVQSPPELEDADDQTDNGLLVRLGPGDMSIARPAAQWAVEEGHERAVTFCPDYEFGYESCGGFAEEFEELGGEVVEEMWSALDTQDYSTYIAQIRQADPETIFVGHTGGDAIRFVQSWADFDLDEDVALIGGSSLLDQAVLRSMGDPAEGLYSVSYYAEGGELAETAEFVEAYQEEYSELPSLFAAATFTSAQWLAQAVAELDSGATDAEDLVAAMQEISWASPFGRLELDDDLQAVYHAYLRQVERRDDGELWNVVTEDLGSVRQ